MKKSYIAPLSEAIALAPEAALLLTASDPIPKGEGTTGGSESLSNRHAWDSDNWTGAGDEED